MPDSRYAIAALALALTLSLSASAPGATAIAAHTETEQSAWFYGQPPGQYVVRFFAYHYDGDSTPYVLGTNAYSSNGIVKANAALTDLASSYEGGEGPVYEVKACLYAESDTTGSTPIACTPDTYAGYYPPAIWLYSGAKRRG